MVSRYYLVALVVVFLLTFDQMNGQITFSRNWKTGKRADECSRLGTEFQIKLFRMIKEETKRMARCGTLPYFDVSEEN